MGLALVGAGSAHAVGASGCGVSSGPVLESHPVTIRAGGTALGLVYLGWFPDCKGTYAEIHWNYGPSDPVPETSTQAGVDVFRPQGFLEMRDPNGAGIARINFNLDHLDGSYTTTPIQSIYTDPSGSWYTVDKIFEPVVRLTVYETSMDSSGWYTSEPCNMSWIFGNNHNFNNGAWGSGNYGDC
ncbi:hypothetical protein ACIQBJ_01130 [Kitasatospora sp. NPDC088391]|uniref:hypothetical protein n=1 Tax=Kitasatospora sp. NPDC088391 TaxID=3364074 RepID=UPI003811FBDF